jgi:hypothetical protein
MGKSLIHAAAIAIDAASAPIMAFFAVRALLESLHRNADAARLLLADGVLITLAFGVGAALLKIIELGTWHEIGVFAFVLVLRSAMKRVFAAERRMLARSKSLPW